MSEPIPAPATDSEVDRGQLSYRLLLSAIACLAISAMAYFAMVRTTLGQRFDNAALIGAFQQNAADRIDDSFFVSKVSAAAFYLALALVIGGTLARHRPRLGLSLAGTAVAAVLFTHFLKVDVLTRPLLVAANDAVASHNTYPSGHTATAIAAALILVVASPPQIRGLVAVLAGTYASIIAQDIQTAPAAGVTTWGWVAIVLVAALIWYYAVRK